MIRGSIYVTTDINMLQNLLGTSRIVIIGEPDPALVNNTNAVVASILMPPYSAMAHYVDGDMQTFQIEYFKHLSTIGMQEFLPVILKALCKGINITIYTTRDEYEMYFQVFAQYMINAFGIVIGNENVPFSFNPAYIPTICEILYGMNEISVEELFVEYPAGIPFSNNIIMKLINDVNPYVKDTSFQSYISYFNNYKERIKRNNNRYLETAIVRGRC